MNSYYTWRGQNVVPAAPPAIAYERYDCSAFEPTPGACSFGTLRLDILKAAALGQRYAFRVRPMREVGLWCNPWGTDWNDAAFLSGYRAHVYALAQYLSEYNLLKHVAWVEIAYGSWGEGADCGDYRDRTLMHIVDTYLQAFPVTRLLIPAKTRPLAIYHFLAGRIDDIGVRIDNFGGPDDYFADILHECRGLFCAGEFRNPTKMAAEGGDYARAARQVREWRALVGNGNLPKWEALNPEQQAALLSIAVE